MGSSLGKGLLARTKTLLKWSAGRVLYASPLGVGQTGMRLAEGGSAGAEVQILLRLKYRELLQQGMPLPRFDEVGFRAYSQFDEDGILLYIFSLIGTTNRRAVEICAGHGIECNTANLIINHGWEGLLFDGKIENVLNGRAFYARTQDTLLFPPAFVHAWIDRDNVNGLITRHGFSGEIDLLSLDMDGVDYWIWRALDCVRPRVVVLEYQGILDPHPITVPYSRGFDRHDLDIDYYGASLTAFVRLGKAKGYRLVGCNRNQLNAFFIRDGIGEDALPELPPESCFDGPRLSRWRAERFGRVARYRWTEV